MVGGKEAPRVRRKQVAGENVKHRRTRSGCFTCRSRRVKCDEARPTCERCQKGSRGCTYPEPTSKTAGSSAKKAAFNDSSSSGEEIVEDEDHIKLETIADDDDIDNIEDRKRPSMTTTGPKSRTPVTTSPSSSRKSPETSSETPPLIPDKGDTPPTEGSSTFSRTQSGSSASKLPGKPRSDSSTKPEDTSSPNIDWTHLPRDLQYYLSYHQKYLTPYYYSLRQNEAAQFFRTTFLELAVCNEPLLHAVAGFAAFQRTVKKNGKIQDYLGYYNKSVSLLLQSLQKSLKHTEAILLTILQLATVEEYFGDWVNLLGHQKAALEILLELYTPQSITETPTSRMVFAWYSRFDLTVAHLTGYETGLSRDWYYAYQNYHASECRRHPEEVKYKVQEAVAAHRLLAMDLAVLFAKRTLGAMSAEEFALENKEISLRMAIWKDEMDPDLRNPTYAVKSFAVSRPLDTSDIVNPYEPGILYQGPLRTMNFVVMDWHAVEMMHKYQTALVLQAQPSQELAFLALKICQMFEALELWPQSDPGSLIAAQSALGIASLFLPKDAKHIMWCRRKLAKVESMGWIYPQTFRERMSTLWGIPEVKHWWLPNDEGYPPIIRSIRSFVDDRTMTPRSQPGEDLRNMKAIFSEVKLEDSPEPAEERLVHTGKAQALRVGEPEVDFGAGPRQDMLDSYATSSVYWARQPFVPGRHPH
ncbi:MAG: hypothetical protein M1836_006538 [Candelina mexicana]|nr:MAG: hypothetical protein M1836_006538 [Candelina mexicana]